MNESFPNKEIVHWKTKDGRLLSVDDMDNNHVRNAFKMLIKNRNALLKAYMDLVLECGSRNSIKLNGEIAQFFNDEQDNLTNDDE
jgi:hypothetical protein